jgi:4'-phosphopantetheinyl transferase
MNRASCWQPPERVTLTTGEVHLWLASLEQPAACLDLFETTLTPDERERATRFVFAKDQRKFIAARGILRALLGHYLHVPPATLHLTANPYGKPALETPASQPALRFNLSHSHELALYAFAYERELGVDIEYMRTLPPEDYALIARRHFTPNEYTTLAALPDKLQQQAFFNCWTRKEAYLKARGMGMSIPLESFEVSLAPGAPAALLASAEASHPVDAWEITLPLVPTGYTAALVVEGHGWQARSWAWGNALADQA